MSNSAPPSPACGHVDDVVRALMTEHRIPGLSLAVIAGGKIARAQGYGFIDRSNETPVTADTLFQAASLSKPLAALGAMKLVEQGALTLDEDVNVKLKSWRVPENEFTAQEKVTLRRILSHSAGLTVHGFLGHASGRSLPTLLQVLNGAPPARTPAIVVDTIPGRQRRYSGGGYMVLQQLMIDVTGRPFDEWMQKFVLGPIGMVSSSFAALSESLALMAGKGHLPNGNALPGRWHHFTEMAAASLWTTPSDLARFAVAMQQSLVETPGPVLSPAITREMLTRQIGGSGLGVALEGEGKHISLVHSGRNPGFDALMVASAESGTGAIMMFNMNVGGQVASLVLQAIIKEHWPRPSA